MNWEVGSMRRIRLTSVAWTSISLWLILHHSPQAERLSLTECEQHWDTKSKHSADFVESMSTSHGFVSQKTNMDFETPKKALLVRI